MWCLSTSSFSAPQHDLSSTHLLFFLLYEGLILARGYSRDLLSSAPTCFCTDTTSFNVHWCREAAENLEEVVSRPSSRQSPSLIGVMESVLGFVVYEEGTSFGSEDRSPGLDSQWWKERCSETSLWWSGGLTARLETTLRHHTSSMKCVTSASCFGRHRGDTISRSVWYMHTRR